MRITTFLLVAAFLCVQFAPRGATWYGFGVRQRYTFTVTDEDIAKTPIWAEDAEQPPLPARKALSLAKHKLTEVEGSPKQWRLDSLSLSPWRDGRHWIYLARYEEVREPQTPDGWILGPPRIIVIPVLMSGVAVDPKIETKKE
jgi:hypothetical protein